MALNVKINCSGFDDKAYVADALAQADNMLERAKKMEREIIEIVEKLVG